MQNKNRLRKKYFALRKKKYFEIEPLFFAPLTNLINKNFKSQKINLSLYYPSSFEVNVLKFFNLNNSNRIKVNLPVITEKNNMKFCRWKNRDILKVNKFGMLEPSNTSVSIVPKIMLIPLLAFDNQNYRLGYGGGYYDKYLNKYLKANKNILTIGIAFSFQKHNKLPNNSHDVKLDLILTEKGFLK